MDKNWYQLYPKYVPKCRSYLQKTTLRPPNQTSTRRRNSFQDFPKHMNKSAGDGGQKAGHNLTSILPRLPSFSLKEIYRKLPETMNPAKLSNFTMILWKLILKILAKFVVSWNKSEVMLQRTWTYPLLKPCAASLRVSTYLKVFVQTLNNCVMWTQRVNKSTIFIKCVKTSDGRESF